MSESTRLLQFARLKKEAGQDFWFNALGKSMRPWIPSGSTVRIRPAQTCEKGDIVLAAFGSSVVLHRVVNVREDALVLRGDWNTQRQVIPPKHLLGIALECTRPSGRTITLRRTWFNRLWLSVCVGVDLRKRLFQPLSNVNLRE